jgi:hypothetical protein
MGRTQLFLVTNAGLHPIASKLKRQYSNDIVCSDVTFGNVPLSPEYAKTVAKNVHTIMMEHDEADVFVVFSGFPIYNLIVFETVKRIFNKLPIVLVYNKETRLYMEFDLNIRRLLFEEAVIP